MRPIDGAFSDYGEQLYEFRQLGDEIEFENYALYAAYRTSGKFYLLAKGGYLYRETDISRPSRKTNISYKASDYGSNFSLCLGGGLRLGNIQAEIQFSRLSDDIDFIELGANYVF